MELQESKWKQFMRIEIAALVFGIFNIITSFDAIIVSIVAIACRLPLFSSMLAPWTDRPERDEDISDRFPDTLTNGSYMAVTSESWDKLVRFWLDDVGPPVLIVLGVVALIFSALLVAGVIKKKSGFVKSFFIYGVITMPASLAFNLLCVIIFIGHGAYQYLCPHVGILFLHVIFALELYVVHRTYRKFESPTVKQFNHERLDES